MRVRALIVEDEPIARQRLRALIADTEWLECVGEAENGPAALRAIDELQPDLVFLDIELPEMSGLEVLERITHQPLVIFTTAYSKYAVAAFELEALDYLIKPFGPERFSSALERVRKSLKQPDHVPSLARAREGLAHDQPLNRLFVRDRGKIVPVDLHDVLYLAAEDDYVAVHLPGRRYLVYLPLTDFERRLDPARFVRIHRSYIVNLDHVTALVPFDPHRLNVELRDGTRLLASRDRSKSLRALIV
jgi:two-component system, LytTR family, response regulator